MNLNLVLITYLWIVHVRTDLYIHREDNDVNKYLGDRTEMESPPSMSDPLPTQPHPISPLEVNPTLSNYWYVLSLHSKKHLFIYL